jgi:GNAT superfamily N-acetyltransferase
MSCAGRKLDPTDAAAFRAALTFEQLNEKHASMIPQFKSHTRIDDYLTRLALEDAKEKRSKSWVLVHENRFLVSYISLALGVVSIGEAEREAHGMVGRAEFPGVLIGQLGTDHGYQGRGLAKRLLKFAVGQATAIAEIVGCRVLIAQVNMEEPAITMYRNAGFERSTHRLYKDEIKTQTHFLDLFTNPPVRL